MPTLGVVTVYYLFDGMYKGIGVGKGQLKIKSRLRRVTFTMRTHRMTITKQRGDDYREVTVH